MKLLKLILRNTFRHRLRTVLTIVGLGLTIMSFGIVRNILELFDISGNSAIRKEHLISRHKTSIMQYLPVAYMDKMAEVKGVKYVSYAHWVGMKYGDKPEEYFAKMAVEPMHYFDVRPEFKIPPEQLKEFQKNKTGCLVTKALMLKKGWKIGDQVTVSADFFEGVDWKLTIVGEIEMEGESAQGEIMMFRADYFSQRLGEVISPDLDKMAGWFELIVDNSKEAPTIARRIDSLFMNSPNETLTETVGDYASSQVERFRTIITALQVSSYLMIVVVLLVLLNTMSMVARERTSENAVLKTLGFRANHLTVLNMGESLLVALLGGILGAFLIWPGLKIFTVALNVFSGMKYNFNVLIWIVPAVLIVGILAAVVPIFKATRTTIVEGLRVLE